MTKFLVELDEQQTETLTRFQNKTQCKYRIDAIRLLLDFITMNEDSNNFALIFTNGSRMNFLAVNDYGVVNENINSILNPEIEESLITFHYVKNNVVEVTKDTKTNHDFLNLEGSENVVKKNI